MSVRKALAALAVGTLAIGTGAAVAGGGNSHDNAFGSFEEVESSVACTAGGNGDRQFILPDGFTQRVFAREGEAGTANNWDMNTQNETGRQKGRYLYRTHEVGAPSSVSVTDLRRNTTRVLAQRADWEVLDGIVWTPWGTLLVAEEVVTSRVKDPALPGAKGGHVYEINPTNGVARLRAAVGSRSHEGLRFDEEGNLYGISEASPPTGGYIYKFTPDRPGDLSRGTLYALRVTGATPAGDRVGDATWVPLDDAAVALDSDAAATAAGATGYARPEDVETGASTGEDPLGNTLYVAITGEDRVLAIDLGVGDNSTAIVSDYVRAGVNAPEDFDSPDNLALDRYGNLIIGEDPGGTFAAGKRIGDDVWAATPPFLPFTPGPTLAADTLRFATLTDCDAEPTGMYFDITKDVLYVNVQHKGGTGTDALDQGVVIYPPGARFAGS